MAAASVLAVMNGSAKDIHSFFTRPREFSTGEKHDPSVRRDCHIHQPSEPFVEEPPVSVAPNKKRKTTKDESIVHTKGKTQRTLQDILNPKAETSVDNAESNADNAVVTGYTEETPVTGNGLSRNLAVVPPGPGILIDAATTKETHEKAGLVNNIVEHPIVEIPSKPSQKTAPTSSKCVTPPPRRVLRLKPNGTFASPPKPDIDFEESSVPVKSQSRGRSRKSGNTKGITKLLICIPYGRKDDKTRVHLGKSIESILAGTYKVSVPSIEKRGTKKPRTPKKPFAIFMDKKKPESSNIPKEAPRKTSTVTPGKLRTQTLNMNEHRPDWNSSTFDLGAGLFKDRLLMKQPGAKEPSWPSKQQAHVRAYDAEDLRLTEEIRQRCTTILNERRKGKSASLPLPKSERILNRFATNLRPEPCGAQRVDGFQDPHPSLHIPEKLFISGEQILDRLTAELAHDSDRNTFLEASQSINFTNACHPAIMELRDNIKVRLTAWDENKGESLPWTQKYAPDKAAKVLQKPRELEVLRQWLVSHTITAVENSADSRPVRVDGISKKKRRRKRDELDDFLVHSDDEDRSMQEISPAEGVDELELPRSLIQEVANGERTSNAVLLSGPHGCGKTAAIYATARELGFKVFEISSHERRAGKDVVDKIGDMTANHLVKHHGTDSTMDSADEGTSQVDEVESDIASGRQITMTSFFSTKPKAKQAPREALLKRQALDTIQKTAKAAAKSQQQSLILLEEVDVLFKEDKDFWTTIYRLMLSSKRPFIMTCNDEALVPLQATSLHAILRFVSPPMELAVDHMLLVAAQEGHLLSRHAVTSLYEYRQHDLRASISELNFWCQMGVGDCRGGLGWLFQRWPPGAGRDTDGRQLRVVSGSTYLACMHSPQFNLNDTESFMMEEWHNNGLSPTDVLGWNSSSTAEIFRRRPGNSSRKQRRAALDQFTAFADTLSDADLYAATCSIGDNRLATDKPDMPEKLRAHYIEGMHVLQTDAVTEHAQISERIAIFMASAAFQVSGLSATNKAMRATLEPAYMNRKDFACFDAIAVSNEPGTSTASAGLQLSAFDGSFATLVSDLAPYARSIVRSDLALQQYRDRLEGILGDADSDTSRKPKRARTTRAARSALEGGQRASTRKEQWFTPSLDPKAVLATGGSTWGTLIDMITPSEAVSVGGSQDQAMEDA